MKKTTAIILMLISVSLAKANDCTVSCFGVGEKREGEPYNAKWTSTEPVYSVDVKCNSRVRVDFRAIGTASVDIEAKELCFYYSAKGCKCPDSFYKWSKQSTKTVSIKSIAVHEGGCVSEDEGGIA